MKKKVLKVLENVIANVSKKSLDYPSFWGIYEPDVPEELKKMTEQYNHVKKNGK